VVGSGQYLVSLRAKSTKYLAAIFNGVLAGFVEFLIVKGGKFVFLVNIAPASTIFINSFATAFAGVISSLFTEKDIKYFQVSQIKSVIKSLERIK